MLRLLSSAASAFGLGARDSDEGVEEVIPALQLALGEALERVVQSVADAEVALRGDGGGGDKRAACVTATPLALALAWAPLFKFDADSTSLDFF